jgi:hypothetical protein
LDLLVGPVDGGGGVVVGDGGADGDVAQLGSVSFERSFSDSPSLSGEAFLFRKVSLILDERFQ